MLSNTSNATKFAQNCQSLPKSAQKQFSGAPLAKVLENYERKNIGSWKKNQGKNSNFFEVI
jgi:hypothetical protein